VYIVESGRFCAGPKAWYGREFQHCVELLAACHRAQEKAPQAEDEEGHGYAGVTVSSQQQALI
jgi:hypothetical protein